jgi:hypothetical protein
VSPLVTTTYQLTVSQNGCTRIDQVTVNVNVSYNPIADAGTGLTLCKGQNVVIGGSPTGTPPPLTPNAQLGYIWSPATGLNNITVANPVLNISTPGTYTYQVIVFSLGTGCSDTAVVTHVIEDKAKVGNFVWEDRNADGVQNNGEPGINGVPVSLYRSSDNTLVSNTTTNNDPINGTAGYYQFEVCKGSYYIIFGTTQNYVRTFANLGDDNLDSDADRNSGQTSNFVLNPGDNNQSIDAGYFRLASIGDFVWLDINQNGIQDVNENGIPNIEVSITGILNNGTLVPPSIQTTGNNGQYLFSGLIPGRYTIVVNKTTDYNFSPQNQGTDDEKDSDSNPLTGVMPEETLESGENNLTYDAGLFPSINLQIEKTFISAIAQADGSFNVNYTIQVTNSGGSGLYDLTDNQGFDTDVLINNASYTSNAPGNPGSNLFGTGTWILANDQPISANGTHTYNLLVNVRLNLTDNIGNNIYQPCLTQNPSSGNGLYNQAKVYVNDILKDQDDACGDLPNITMIKDFVNVIPQANGSYNVLYRITVGNNGGATGSYSLKDIPQFDDDVVINSGSYSGQASGAE